MPIARKLIDWTQPILRGGADYLAERYAAAGQFNLENVLVVLPGRCAGRLLLELLVDLAADRQLVLVPPTIETAGDLPEHLYETKRQLAGPLLQQLAWAQALKSLGRRRLARLIAQPPADRETDRWLELGELLWRQHRELAADGLDFADVQQVGKSTAGFEEGGRWQLLREVQLAYLRILHEQDRWDRQTARLFAVEHEECRTDKDIVLIATADLNRTIRQMLAQVADRVTALVHAPDALTDRFDQFGAILPEAWQDAHLPLSADQVRVVSGPQQQAAAVARVLAGYDGRYAADQISVGVPDDSLLPQVERELSQHGIPSRSVVGRPLTDTLPYRLLEAVADFVDRQQFRGFAALVRHADVHRWITRQGIAGDWLTELDEYYSNHLQSSLKSWLGSASKNATIRSIYQAITCTVAPLSDAPRPLGGWSIVIAQLLTAFYDGTQLDREDAADHFTLAACEKIRQVLTEHEAIPDEIAPAYTAVQAIRLVLEQLQAVRIPPPAGENSIELLGWLELPTDPAPALVVTSINEGFVPTSLNSDLFLPNALRRRLQIVDNQRRYARDAYALSVLLASRDDLTLIVGRQDAEGNPLVPSRLLFATDPQTIAERAREFFDPGIAADESAGTAQIAGIQTAASDFVVPRPARLPTPPEKIRVTAFRDYLACPYRFYLRHVLGLSSIDDTAEEMDPAAFGNLIHDVLNQFGQSEVRHTADPTTIAEFLHDALRRTAARCFGRNRLPAVNVQVQQAGARLGAFARWQAGWAEQGWRIRKTEENTRFELSAGDGRSIRVTGRIDRVDENEQTGRWAVFDYKTSDNAKTPNQMHRRGDDWVDLQLPLYRHLVREMGIEQEVQLGYIVLPKNIDSVGALIADWDAADLASADAAIQRVAHGVLDQIFWPPKYPPPRFAQEYAAICQDSVFERRLGAEVSPG